MNKAICLFIFLFFVHCGWSFCYFANSCFDPDTAEPVTTDRVWNTSKCHRCRCASHVVPVMTCYEIDSVIVTSNNSKMNEKPNEISDETMSVNWNYKQEIVEIPPENATHFKCPDLVHPALEPGPEEYIFPNLKQVEYFTQMRDMECCSIYFTPVNVDTQKCDVIWRKEECRYDIIDKKTGGQCQQNSTSYVGK